MTRWQLDGTSKPTPKGNNLRGKEELTSTPVRVMDSSQIPPSGILAGGDHKDNDPIRYIDNYYQD